MTNAASDSLQFFRTWLSDPLRVGAVTPSGEALAHEMTRELSEGPVLELGPGTGVFTRAILARGIDESSLTLVESEAKFAALLGRHFPKARIIDIDAAHLSGHGLFEGAPLAAVISGLPLLSMPDQKVSDILSGAFAHLRDGGAFYQFTYAWVCPIRRHILDRLGLRSEGLGWTIRNVPPAKVYRITRRQTGLA
jgi:phosphatidylethanolamine/phosphatidyl-N-methylethanolamine N-methyltransferase